MMTPRHVLVISRRDAWQSHRNNEKWGRDEQLDQEGSGPAISLLVHHADPHCHAVMSTACWKPAGVLYLNRQTAAQEHAILAARDAGVGPE